MGIEILVVNAPGTAQPQDAWYCPPLNLLCLAAYARAQGIGVEVVDGNAVGWDGVMEALDRRPQAVGITMLTWGRHAALEVLRRAKARGARTIAGGAHASACSRQILEHYPFVDAICVGEGEAALLSWLRGGPAEAAPLDLAELAMPAWDLLYTQVPPDRYPSWPTANLHFSRGCPGQCSFCHSWVAWGGWRSRSPVAVANEMLMLAERWGFRSFEFHDDCFTGRAENVHDLCFVFKQMLGAAPVSWGCTTRADLVDDALLAHMRATGCTQVALGLESGSNKILELAKKGVTVRQNVEGGLAVKRAGLILTALVMVGNPGETDETIEQTAAMLRAIQPDKIGTVGRVWVFPATRLWARLKREHRFTEDYWLEQPGEPPTWPAADEATLARWTARIHDWRRE
jgi:radical SAM superfamily enzyme YgiQ (UPF0313 family)